MTETLFIVDAIDEGITRLILADDERFTFTLPANVLPPEARPGAYVRAAFSLDAAALQAEADKAKKLLDDLTAGQDPNQTEFNL